MAQELFSVADVFAWTIVLVALLFLLEAQEAEMRGLFGALTEAQAGHRYAPGKWSLKELVGHLTDVERIFAPILAENTRSRRLAEKVGFTLDGVMRSALVFHSRRSDEAVYSILRSEWMRDTL